MSRERVNHGSSFRMQLLSYIKGFSVKLHKVCFNYRRSSGLTTPTIEKCDGVNPVIVHRKGGSLCFFPWEAGRPSSWDGCCCGWRINELVFSCLWPHGSRMCEASWNLNCGRLLVCHFLKSNTKASLATVFLHAMSILLFVLMFVCVKKPQWPNMAFCN